MNESGEQKPLSDEASAGRPLWVVSELYYPEETSTGHYLTQIAEGLATRGPVRAVCGQPTYSKRGIRAAGREYRHGVEIRRCGGTTFNKDVLLLRLINVVTVSWTIFLHLLLSLRRGDRVLVVTNPPLLPFVAALACRVRGARCLLLIHDVYPEVCIASGLLPRRHWLTKILDRRVKHLYRTVDRIVVLGRDMDTLVRKKLNVPQNKITTITNWADLELVNPTSRRRNPLLAELGLSDKFVVQYAGNMGRSHDLESLVECADILRDQPHIHFLFVGSGAKRRWLEQQVRDRKLENTTLLERRPRGELPMLLNACDVAAITFVAGMAGISVPSRMYNVLAAGKPILAVADPLSELARVVAEERVGWVVSPGNPRALAAAIQQAEAARKEFPQIRHRARAVAETKYNLPTILEAYAGLVGYPTPQEMPKRIAA